jgi:hypothetical protein
MDTKRAVAVAQLASVAIALAALACGSSGASSLLGTERNRTAGGGTELDGGGIAYGGVILPSKDGSCPNGMLACNGVCSDTSTDVDNCGACGVVCGGTCALSRCTVTLASGGVVGGGPGSIAVSGGNVYYFGANSLMSVPVGGGTPATVAAVTGNAIAVSDTTIYWATNTSILSKATAGGTLTTLAPVGGGSIAAGPSGVYWTTDSNVMSVPLTGLGDGGLPTTLAVGQNDPFGITLGPSEVYWTTGGTLASGGGFAANSGSVEGVAVIEEADGGAPDGGDDAGATHHAKATTVAAAQNYPHGIATDGANVYWAASGSSAASYADGTIMSAPLNAVADAGAPAALATAQPFPYDVAVDATTLYWTCNDNGGTSGGVMSLPLGGGAAVPLAKGQNAPGAIAVDATSVYWMSGTGALMKLTPK